MANITISSGIKGKIPHVKLGTIICEVQNSSFHQDLWDVIHEEIELIKNRVQIPQIKDIPAIKATREAYKALGKDPNRYRPSAESLHRRILRGLDLYQINTLVDLINYISLKTGFSIGGFDAVAVKWPVTYGVGKAGEAYVGIGRGELNIENLPILRDQAGGIGTPTSDEIRTKIELSTSKLYMNINDFTGQENLQETIDWSVKLLKTYVSAREIYTTIIK